MGACAGPQLVDKLNATGNGGAKTDAIIGAVDIIVHRLGNGDDGKALAMETLAVAQGIVTADGNQRVNAQVLQVLENVGREITGTRVLRFRLGVLWIFKKLRYIVGPHPTGIGPARMEEGAAGTVNGPHPLRVQGHHILVKTIRVVSVELQEPPPAAADTKHLVPLTAGAIDNFLYRRVEAGNVPASGQDTDLHDSSLLLSLPASISLWINTVDQSRRARTKFAVQ